MSKVKKIEELNNLYKEKGITEKEYLQLKDEIINEKKDSWKRQTESINWLAIISLLALIGLHFISVISIVVTTEGSISGYDSQEYSGSTDVFFPAVYYGALSLIVSIGTLICSFFRLRFLWIGGIFITLMILLAFLFGGSLTNSISATSGAVSATAASNIRFSPGFFYMLFALFLFGFSFVFEKIKKPVFQNFKLNKITIIFAVIGIIGALLKIIQETSPILANIGSGDDWVGRSHYSIILDARFPSEWIPTEGPLTFLQHDSIYTTIWATIYGLCLLGFPLLILVSQIFILLKKRIFIFVFILPWLICLFIKIFQGTYNAGGSEYYGYIMNIFWNMEPDSYSPGLHAFGSTIFYYLMPLVFFYVYYREKHKMS